MTMMMMLIMLLWVYGVVQATQSEGHVTQRAAAWCRGIGVLYFRFSPWMKKDIPLDCKDDATLINMLWETRCFIHDHHDRFVQLGSLLCRSGENKRSHGEPSPPNAANSPKHE